MVSRITRCALLAFLGLLSAPVLGADDVLTPERAIALPHVGAVAIAPDGRTIAYVLSVAREADDEPGSACAEVWIVQTDDGMPRRFSRPKAHAGSPRWSPDGAWLAFTDQRGEVSDVTQVFVMPVAGGEARPVTDHETAVRAFRWSPDGRRIAYSARDAKTEQQEADEEAGRDWRVVGQDERPVRLWIVDVEGGEPRAVYDGALSTWDFEWTPDGESLVIRASADTDTDAEMMGSQLYLVPAGGGEPRALGTSPGKLGQIAVSPDGRRVAYLGATSRNDPLPQSVLLVDLAGARAAPGAAGQPRLLTPDLEASIAGLAWTPDQQLVLLADVGARTQLMRLDVSHALEAGATLGGADGDAPAAAAGGRGGAAPQPVIADMPVASRFDLAADGETVALVASTSQHPAEVYVGSLRERTTRRLSEHSAEALTGVRLGRQEVIEWLGAESLPIQGVLTYPVDFEEAARYPLVIHPHGGPEGVSQDGWNTFAQLLAGRGYLVLQPNYRGSGGRGVAFSKGDHDDLGGREFEDILAGLRMLVERGLADEQRVAMAGWSYGGYLSAMAATHHSETFDAAVMGAGISNWVSFAGTTDIPHEMSLVHWNRYAYDNFALYWERSPLSAIGRARTPTLILHGADDQRVGPGQAWELYTALKMRDVPTELVLYPRSGHGVSERAHRIDMWTRQLDWFDRWVK